MNIRASLAIALTLGSLISSARADITSGLVLDLPLDETTGTIAHDQSPNAFTGTIVNMTSDAQWIAGWITNGLNLNQAPVINQYISFPDAPSLNFTTSLTFTLATWVKFPNSQISGAAFIAKGTGGGFEQYDLDWSAAGTAGRYRLVARNSGGTATTLIANVAAANNQWQHVAVTFDGATTKSARIYINGQLNVAATNNNFSSLRGSAHEVTIGSRQSGTGAYNLPTTNIVFDEV